MDGHPVSGNRSVEVVGRLFLWCLAVLAGVGLVSLALAMAGLLTPWAAWPLGLFLALLFRRRLPETLGQSGLIVSLLVVGIAVAVVAVGWWGPHEHVLGGRDGGTYVATAAWVAENGSILMAKESSVFGGVEVAYDSLGFRSHPGGETIYPQFMHLFPVMMGLAAATFGKAAMFSVGPVIGGVAIVGIFLVARRFVSPWWALLATVVMAASLPMLYFSRAPFSEPTALVFAIGGLLVLDHALSSASRTLAAVGGGLLGAVFVARLDGIIVLLALAVFAGALEILGRSESEIRLARVAWVAGVAVAAIGMLDGLFFSPFYIADHGRLLIPVLAVILAIRILAPMLARGKLGDLARELPDHFANGVAALAGLWLLAAAFLVGEVTTGQWLSWYLGVPLLVAGLGGTAWRLRTFLAGGDAGRGLMVTVAFVAAAIYLFRPSIAPDHIWAMRRFLPVILPFLIVFGLWVAAEVVRRTKGAIRAALVAGAVAASLVPGVLTSWHPGFGSELDGGAAFADDLCHEIGSSTILFVGQGAGTAADVLMPLVRGWCGLPVAREVPEKPLAADEWLRIAGASAENGLQLVVLGGTGGDRLDLANREFQRLEISYNSPPRSWEPLPVGITGELVSP